MAFCTNCGLVLQPGQKCPSCHTISMHYSEVGPPPSEPTIVITKQKPTSTITAAVVALVAFIVGGTILVLVGTVLVLAPNIISSSSADPSTNYSNQQEKRPANVAKNGDLIQRSNTARNDNAEVSTPSLPQREPKPSKIETRQTESEPVPENPKRSTGVNTSSPIYSNVNRSVYSMANTMPRPRSTLAIVNSSFPVPAGRYMRFAFTITREGRLKGYFTAIGGNNDINCVVTNSQGQIYQSGYVTGSRVDMNLEPGSYALHFDNRAALITPKVVTAYFHVE